MEVEILVRTRKWGQSSEDVSSSVSNGEGRLFEFRWRRTSHPAVSHWALSGAGEGSTVKL